MKKEIIILIAILILLIILILVFNNFDSVSDGGNYSQIETQMRKLWY